MTMNQESLCVQPPLFQHDCELCTYLGRYHDPERDEDSDLYVHTAGSTPTVISRYGSNGPEYSSGLYGSYGQIPALSEARQRAERLGLLTYSVYQALEYARLGSPDYAVMLDALTFTEEILAYRAYQSNDLNRAYDLLEHLLVLARRDSDVDESERLLQVTSRLCQILIVREGLPGPEGWKRAFKMMEPWWAKLDTGSGELA